MVAAHLRSSLKRADTVVIVKPHRSKPPTALLDFEFRLAFQCCRVPNVGQRASNGAQACRKLTSASRRVRAGTFGGITSQFWESISHRSSRSFCASWATFLSAATVTWIPPGPASPCMSHVSFCTVSPYAHEPQLTRKQCAISRVASSVEGAIPPADPASHRGRTNDFHGVTDECSAYLPGIS